MPVQVISLGYERRDIDELVNILVSYNVRKLLDVREAPISRRKDFCKNVLSEYLKGVGIEYIHILSAGNPHRKDKKDIKRCLQLYAKYLGKNPAVIELVATELNGKSVAVLCYERDHERCHRSVLLDEVRKHGYSIKIVSVD